MMTIKHKNSFSKANQLPGMGRNNFCTFGSGNGKWPSLFPTYKIVNGNIKKITTFRIGNGNEQSNFQQLGLKMGMKTSFSTFGNGKLHLISQKVGNVIGNFKMLLPLKALC